MKPVINTNLTMRHMEYHAKSEASSLKIERVMLNLVFAVFAAFLPFLRFFSKIKKKYF